MGARDSCYRTRRQLLGMDGPPCPGVAFVTTLPVDDVWWSGWATSSSGGRGLTRRPLQSIQGRGMVTSLSHWGHVRRPPFDHGHSPFHGDLSLSRTEWALSGEAKPFPQESGIGSGKTESSRGGRGLGEAEPSDEF